VSARGGPLALILTAALFLALLVAAAPAGAIVTPVGGREYGVEPETAAVSHGATPLGYESGPVVHSNAPYAIYWDPKSGTYSGEWQTLISGFLKEAGGASETLDNVFAVATQYRDTTGANVAYNSTFRGAYTDVDPYPTSANCSEPSPCLTDAQIRTELTKYISANELPSGLNPASGPTPIYFIFTPPGTTVCLEGSGEHGHCSTHATANALCSYHSFIPAGGQLPGTVLYAVQPWTAGTDGTVGVTPVSGTNCQDGSGTLQEPNQIVSGGLGPDGEYNAGLADLIINEVADEQIATTTDPLLTGWRNAGAEGEEVPDKCRNDFLGGLLTKLPGTQEEANTKAWTEFNQIIGGRNYYLNDEFDQAAVYAPYPGVRCINRVNLAPDFTAQNTVRSGDQVTFNTTQSVVDLGIAKYHWDFGDGTSADVNCEGRTPTNGASPQECTGSSGTGNPNPVGSVVHHYTYGGTYTVRLTLTDDGGNTASVTNSVTAEGSPPPPPPTEPAGSVQTPATTSSSSSSSSSASSSSGGGTPTAIPNPAATASIASRSLRSVLRNGLVVRYSVNERVTGRFEVLLATSVARRIGLHGSPATGLAKGTAPQTIIGRAILVTTAGGHNTVKIQFSKATAARLRRLHNASVMLRLIVRNASAGSTTVLSTIALSG
jgi:PKD repeat protein